MLQGRKGALHAARGLRGHVAAQLSLLHRGGEGIRAGQGHIAAQLSLLHRGGDLRSGRGETEEDVKG